MVQSMRPAIIIHNAHSWQLRFPVARGTSLLQQPRRTISSAVVSSVCSSSSRPLRFAVLGAGFAGLSVVWNLLQNLPSQDSPREMNFCIDIYDEVGIGGGASGVSGGLLHPYSPKVKLLWRGAECWKESLMLLNVADAALKSKRLNMKIQEHSQDTEDFIIRRGILRPAVNEKSLNTLTDNAQDCIAACRIESINQKVAESLVPNVYLPLDLAFYMPEAINVHPQRYLEALYLACENLVKSFSTSNYCGKKLSMCKKSINNLHGLSGDYDAVIICLGARAAFLPELFGRLPLRMCRGVITHLQLPDEFREEYPGHSPSILSDAWLSVKGPRTLRLGSTWEWKSRNYLSYVSLEEASNALRELLPKASVVYPSIKKWTTTGASGGLRAMPPLTSYGSLPLLGCVDDFVEERKSCKYWLFTGLGSRGLLYHGLLGKLMAQAVLSCNESLIPFELLSWRR